ncbi:MAG: M36 family metallopeptidase [Polyangiaceae bacterium]
MAQNLRRVRRRFASSIALLSLCCAASAANAQGDRVRSFAPTSSSYSSFAPADAAIEQLFEQALPYTANLEVMATLEPTAVSAVPTGGTIVRFDQTIDGIEVFHASVRALLDRDQNLLATSGEPLSLDVSRARTLAFGPADAAVAAALSNATGDDYSADDLAAVTGRNGYYRFALATTGALRFVDPARAKPVFYADSAHGTVAAYFIELSLGGRGAPYSAYSYVITQGGEVLYREDLVHRAFGYRGWIDPTDGRPLDSPKADTTPHPTGFPDGIRQPFIPPSLFTTDGFNTNPNGLVDPWLAPGATQTRGNNSDAYTDDNNPDGFSAGDIRASTTSPGMFDRVYDTLLEPTANDTQRMAGVTQAFYTTNWLHDRWYDAGFDEASGNAQQDNFGRGGLGADPLLVETQDGTPNKLDNANLSAFEDGQSPRMQIYLWSAPTTSQFQVFPSGTTYQTSIAAYGPGTSDQTGPIVTANDGVNVATDACEPLSNVAAKIVFAERGNCSFKTKSLNAQNAGAIALIIGNNQPNGLPVLGNDFNITTSITIPTIGVAQADSQLILAELQAGTIQSAHVSLVKDALVEAALDNTIVAHEFGHLVHLRLNDCNSSQCGALSEGFGDFIAALMVLRPGDDLNGSYGFSSYASSYSANSSYYGVRRYPLSVDPTRNALTFRHITDNEQLPANVPLNPDVTTNNAEVHAAGEVWASMLFDGYVAMLRRTTMPNPPYTFAEAERRMESYIVAGLKLAPSEATYVEMRDAILAAARAADTSDFDVLAAAFAARGAGTCAVAPPSNSTTFSGVVESFDVMPSLVIRSVELADVESCDADGIIDAGETGLLSVKIENMGWTTSTGASITADATGLTFPSGASVVVPDLLPLESVLVTLPVVAAVDATVTNVSLELDAPNTCAPVLQASLQAPLDSDVAVASSSIDNVEAPTSSLVTSGAGADAIWTRVLTTPLDHAWLGADVPYRSDTALETPDLAVSSSKPLVLSFSHHHQFEFDAQMGSNFDGGVIEVTTDGGATWEDLSTYGAVPYNGTIYNGSNNPLTLQPAFVAQNASWPDDNAVSITLGTVFAGKTIRLRFRLGTDDFVGATGWAIDDLALQGIDNTPFNALVADACIHADAGPDQSVSGGDTVTLDGSATSSPNPGALTFTWSQLDGPTVSLASKTTPVTTFVAPAVTTPTTLTFELSVKTGNFEGTDTVAIVVNPDSGGAGGGAGGGGDGGGGGAADGDGDDDGCGCAVAESGPRSGALVGLVLALAALRRARRRPLNRGDA